MGDTTHTIGTLPGVLRQVHVGRRSGALRVERGEERHILRFVHGQVVDVETNVAELSLPKLLASRGLMPLDIASEIAQGAERGQKPLLQTIQERGDIEKSRLDEVRADQLRTIVQRVAEWVDAQQAFEEGDASGAAEAVPGVSIGDLILTTIAAIKDPNVARYALGDLDRVLVHSTDPQLRFQKITLKPNDGYLLSRVDGTLSVRQVAQLVPASPDEIVQSLFGLYCAGLVDFLELTAQPARLKRVAPAVDTPPTPPPRVAEPATPSPAKPLPPISLQTPRPATPVAPAVVTPSTAPAKTVKEPDNDARHYQDILDFHSDLKIKNHFEILGLTRSATETQVREAYFQLAKRYHPDVHRGPVFAEVSDKIAAILVRLGEAYEVLKDPTRRGSYESLVASKMPRPPSGDGSPASTSGPSSAGDSQLGAKLVEEALRSGEKLFSEEKYWEAIQAIEPQLSRTHGTMRVRARVLLAKSYLRNPKWVKRAEEQLGLVVEEDPKHVEAHFLLASIYLGGGLRGRALSKFRKVLELSPEHEEARARVSELTPPPEPTPPPSGGFIKRIFGRGQEE